VVLFAIAHLDQGGKGRHIQESETNFVGRRQYNGMQEENQWQAGGRIIASRRTNTVSVYIRHQMLPLARVSRH